MAPKPIRLSVHNAEVIVALLADVDGVDPQLPLLDGELVGHRRLTPLERQAVDNLRFQLSRALQIPPGGGR
jgi:hypothetical protein